MLTVIGLTLFLGLLCGLFFWFLIRMIRKTDPKQTDPTEAEEVKSAQEFLPFERIEDGYLKLSGPHYRAVLCCTSTNYQLKTEEERDQIELSFQRFLNTITFPVSFFLETRLIDNRKRREELEANIRETVQTFPALANYARNYLYEMDHVDTGSNLYQKKRYVIVTLAAESQEESGQEEEEILIQKELQGRIQSIRNGLEAAGVHSHLLDRKELTELIYAAYEREDTSYAEALASGEPFSLFVEGTGGLRDLTPAEQLDGILEDALRMLEGAGLGSEPRAKRAEEVLKTLRTEGGSSF